MQKTSIKGFTLVEVLLVIAILAILGVVVIAAINPTKQFATTRDSQRETDLYTIMNALHQYSLDHEGSFPDTLTTNPLVICRTGSSSCEGLSDLSILTNEQVYLVSMPVDPFCETGSTDLCSVEETGYVISLTEEGRLWLFAPNAETKEIGIIK